MKTSISKKIGNKKWACAAAAAFLGLGVFAPGAMAADHRDSLAVDALPEGDFTDVFAYVDPSNNNNVILSFSVNPFTNPSEAPSARFSDDLLYAFKINNSMVNGPAEDMVVQVVFSGGTGGRGAQTYQAYLGPSSLAGTGTLTKRLPTTGTGVVPLCTPASGTQTAAPVYIGQVNTSDYPLRGVTEAQAKVATNVAGFPGQCFAGVRDDSFQTDVGQAVFRIGLNSNTQENLAAHDQDLFRGYGGTNSILGGLRGAGIRADGTSGVDGFGGYDTTVVSISIPKTLLRGSGIPDVSQNGAINKSLIGVWATVSRPTSENFDGWNKTASSTYAQFERMGQQLFNTVFVFAQPIVNSNIVAGTTVASNPATSSNDTNTNAPTQRLTGDGFRKLCPSGPVVSGATALSAAQMKDLANTVGPECDFELFDRFFPDSLTVAGNGPADASSGNPLSNLLGTLTGTTLFPAGTSGSRNTVGNRATLLTLLGFNSDALTGVPLYSGAASLQGNTNRRLQAQLSIPDYLRLNLDTPTDGVRPGAATAGNASPTLALSKWGLQNGRRPADDVTDIVLRITREVADVKFGDKLVLPGVGAALPGGGALGDRRPVNCNLLSLGGGVGLPAALQAIGGVPALLAGLAPASGGTILPLSDKLAGSYTIDVLTPCEESRVFAVLQGTDWIESGADVKNVANQISKEGPMQDTFPYFGNDPVPGETGTHDFPSQVSGIQY